VGCENRASLPKDYDGCTEADDAIVGFANQDCVDGAGDLTSYDDRFYARLGGEIHPNDEAA
jgi:hypothetical protein